MTIESARYERSLDPRERAAHGVFYTPPEIADLVARVAICGLLELRAGIGFDAALEAMDKGEQIAWFARASEALRGIRIHDPSCGAGALLVAMDRALRAIERVTGSLAATLAGADRDERALELARRSLPNAVFAQGDALAPPDRVADVVVTNPPYCGGRYVSFWSAAAKRVANRGVLVVLAPTSWRTGQRYREARRMIEECGATRVIELSHRPFSDAYVDACIALCTPGAGARAHQVADSLEPQRSASGRGGLGRLFWSRRGLLAPPPDDETSGTPTRIPLLVGKVAPFAFPKQPSAFAPLVAEHVREGAASISAHAVPRLLVRRIVGRSWRLTAIVARTPGAVKKDFYVFRPLDPAISLEAYAALLHASPVAKWIARRDQAAKKGDFAQLTLDTLRSIPVPTLITTSATDRALVHEMADREIDTHDACQVSAWLSMRAEEGELIGRTLLEERAREIDAHTRWTALRERLDAFVARMM